MGVTDAGLDDDAVYGGVPPTSVNVWLRRGRMASVVGMLLVNGRPDAVGGGAATVTISTCVTPLASTMRTSASTPSPWPPSSTTCPFTPTATTSGCSDTAVNGGVPPVMVTERNAPGCSDTSRADRLKPPCAGALVTVTATVVRAPLASVTVMVTGLVLPCTAATLSRLSLTEAKATWGFWLVAVYGRLPPLRVSRAISVGTSVKLLVPETASGCALLSLGDGVPS